MRRASASAVGFPHDRPGPGPIPGRGPGDRILPTPPPRSRPLAAAVALVLGLLAGPIVGCNHPDAGSIDLSAAKAAAASSGQKMLEPGSIKRPGRARTQPSAEAPKLAPTGRTAAKH
ncbi:hypothetical protein OJF2_02390 [Aquisphaera giovannonii]|uniref:Uncharacterized protein n=1 Tax=Aquisphaera giovannonii TaxID=406548 RepID=A0A5B9VUK8_9BACT|nr:hypothetical protein [Aquisphaera giovannonii]QEH31774.1 hypothetical protein OJF2_02390 [Aquisphaera giovannonii]